MKIIKVNQQPLEALRANVMVSNITFADGDRVIESSQLSGLYPDLKFPGDFLSDRIYVVSEEKSPEQVLSELKLRNEKVEISAAQNSSDPSAEIKNKIEKLEAEISNFQTQKDKLSELESSLSAKQSELENIKQLLASSQILIDSRARVLEKMSGHQAKLEQIGKKSSDEIKTDRKNRISRFMKGVKRRAHMMEDKKESGIYPPLKFLLIITLLNFLINFAFYLTSFQSSILLITVVSLMILLINSFIVNIFRPLYSKDVKGIEEIIAAQNNNEYKFTEDDYILITNAWVSAYNIELSRIDEVLNQNLQGKDYKELESQVSTVNSEIEALKTQLDSQSDDSMSTEEYYKKRRELDILKIELENQAPAQSAAPQSVDYSKLRSELPFIVFNLIKSPSIAALQNENITVLTQA